jgi:hypothetical protein
MAKSYSRDCNSRETKTMTIYLIEGVVGGFLEIVVARFYRKNTF